jgi:hypothetical protein
VLALGMLVHTVCLMFGGSITHGDMTDGSTLAALEDRVLPIGDERQSSRHYREPRTSKRLSTRLTLQSTHRKCADYTIREVPGLHLYQASAVTNGATARAVCANGVLESSDWTVACLGVCSVPR